MIRFQWFASLSILLLSFFLGPLNLAAQELVFEISIESGGTVTQSMNFGLIDGALAGIDGLDQPAPPPPPEAGFNTFLSMLTPPEGLPNRWLEDYRPLLEFMLTRVEFWEMTFENAQPGSIATVGISNPGGTVIPYRLWLNGPDSLSLEIEVPGTVEIPISAATMIFFWELQDDDPVPTSQQTMGGVKSIFR